MISWCRNPPFVTSSLQSKYAFPACSYIFRSLSSSFRFVVLTLNLSFDFDFAYDLCLLNLVDSFTWTWNLSLNLYFALIIVESFSLTLRCTYEHMETGVRMVAASKQLAIKQPVLTCKELEFVNSIVWRLPLTLTLAVSNRILPKELSLTYISISTLGESLGINPQL